MNANRGRLPQLGGLLARSSLLVSAPGSPPRADRRREARDQNRRPFAAICRRRAAPAADLAAASLGSPSLTAASFARIASTHTRPARAASPGAARPGLPVANGRVRRPLVAAVGRRRAVRLGKLGRNAAAPDIPRVRVRQRRRLPILVGRVLNPTEYLLLIGRPAPVIRVPDAPV